MDDEEPVFDEHTPFHDRLETEWWLPYADSEQRRLRDIYVGPCEECYDQQFEPTTEYIRLSEYRNVWTSINFANYHGAYLNVSMTIAWQKMGYFYASQMHSAFEKYKATLRRHLHGQNLPFFHYAVFENSNNFGIHSHEAVHVLSEQLPRFKRWLRRRIAALNRTNYRRALHADYRAKATAERQWRWFKYTMKGLDPQIAEDNLLYYRHLGYRTAHDMVGIQSQRTGVVFHDRVRVSQDMQRKAQKACNYRCGTELENVGPASDRYTDFEFKRGIQDRLNAETSRNLANMEII